MKDRCTAECAATGKQLWRIVYLCVMQKGINTVLGSEIMVTCGCQAHTYCVQDTASSMNGESCS